MGVVQAVIKAVAADTVANSAGDGLLMPCCPAKVSCELFCLMLAPDDIGFDSYGILPNLFC
jgi:hypothetical protein